MTPRPHPWAARQRPPRGPSSAVLVRKDMLVLVLLLLLLLERPVWLLGGRQGALMVMRRRLSRRRPHANIVHRLRLPARGAKTRCWGAEGLVVPHRCHAPLLFPFRQRQLRPRAL